LNCCAQPCACASTGGLVDTVVEGMTGFQMGRLSVDVSDPSFFFSPRPQFILMQNQRRIHAYLLSFSQCDVVEPADVQKVATTLKRAIEVVGTPAHNEMIRNCMTQDLSWKVI
jgi:granule-bound starch synthase